MGHLTYSPARDAEKVGTPERWLPVAAQVAEYTRRFSGRDEIVANVGPGVGGPYGTACWSPILCDLDVNSDTCLPGYSPARVDLTDEVFRLGAQPFMGALTHEAAHARWSAWVPMTLLDRGREGHEAWTKAHVDVVIALEESRIEYLAVRQDASMRDALSQMALSIVLRDFRVAETPYGASIGAALTLARYDAGLFSEAEAAAFREALSMVLSDDTLDTLQALWRRFHRLPTDRATFDVAGGFAAMWQIADEWLAAVREAAGGEGGEGGEGGSGIPGEGGEGGDGEGSGTAFDFDGEGGSESGEDGSEAEAEGPLGKALREAAGEAAMDREGDALDKRAEKVRERKAEEREADRVREREARKVRKARHGEGDDTPGGAHGFSTYAGSHRMTAREPSPQERAAGNRLGGMLAKITWRDRAVTKVDRVVPGGRLRPRAAVHAAADKARGGIAQIPMWRSKERKRTDETPITVGIMTDVSGSMGSASEPSAVLTYVLSHAVQGIDGKVSTAVFGTRGYLVNRAHEKADKVQPWAACDGTEAFREAALLTDLELGLLDGQGARILVIFSDAWLVNDTDERYARAFMALCKAKGVAVIWANVHGVPCTNFGYGALVSVSGSAADIADTLGKAIVAEVKKVEAARG